VVIIRYQRIPHKFKEKIYLPPSNLHPNCNVLPNFKKLQLIP
jgi:hypothetical protein